VKTSTLATLLSLATAIGIAAPMFAADKAATKVSTPAKVSSSSDATTGHPGLDQAVEGGLMVTRVGGVGAALVLGTPVAIVRDTYKSYTTWTPQWADKFGGKDFAPSVALVSIASVPASLVWGTVSGTYHGTHNAFTKGFNEPFNPSSFSMSNDYEQ
jgi:hypothetical protein